MFFVHVNNVLAEMFAKLKLFMADGAPETTTYNAAIKHFARQLKANL